MSYDTAKENGNKEIFWIWDINSDALTLSEDFADIFNCPLGELPESFEDVRSFFSKTDLNDLKQAFQDHVESKGETDFNSTTAHFSFDKEHALNLLWKGGVVKWNEKNEPELMVGSVKKITWYKNIQLEYQPDKNGLNKGYVTDFGEQKEIHKSNIRLKHQFQAVFDTVPNLIFVKDLNGTYIMANKATAEFFGQNPEEIVGKTDVDFGMTKEEAMRFREADREVVENNDMLFIPEVKTIRPDGTKVWHQTIKVPFQQLDSNQPTVLSVVTDVTRRKKNEMELSNSLNIISEQNKRLMNFAHIVSHNLRNHAGNIGMLLSLYDTEESQEEKEELLDHLRMASNQLNESINDLNEIIDQQYKTSNDRKEINLANHVSKIKEILTTDILAHNVTFKEQIPEDLTLKYNPAYLESIILNLLSNAIKYRHPDRKPTIEVEATKKGKSVLFKVSDNGLGIDLDKYGEKLFGMYNTFHNNKNSKGIGLFITKNQIESMGGSIEVESEPDKGTTFTIILAGEK